jgi:hypothetical protein
MGLNIKVFIFQNIHNMDMLSKGLVTKWAVTFSNIANILTT